MPGLIEWVSPLEPDDYAEYRDEATFERLGIGPLLKPLREFWPARGPQWDALGRTSDGAVVLVEAKAHIPEMLSGPSKAVSPAALALIENSLVSTAIWLSAKPRIPWNGPFYQYANRLAHLYLLQEICQIPACLVFVYFVGDGDMKGPATEEEWIGAIKVTHGLLGVSRLPRSLIDVFVRVDDLVGSPPTF